MLLMVKVSGPEKCGTLAPVPHTELSLQVTKELKAPKGLEVSFTPVLKPGVKLPGT